MKIGTNFNSKINEENIVISGNSDLTNYPNSIIEENKKIKKANTTFQVPDNWNQMDAKQKEQYIFNYIGENYIDGWDVKSIEEKKQAIDNIICELTKKIDPNFNKYISEKDKNNSLNATRAIIAMLLEKVNPEDIGKGGLCLAYQKLKNEDQEELKKQFRDYRNNLGITLSNEYKMRLDEEEEIKKYIGCPNNKPITQYDKLSYYRELNKNGKLSDWQQKELEFLETKYKIDPKSLKRSNSKGDMSLTSISDQFENKGYILKDGHLDAKKDTNKKLFLESFNAKYGNTNNLADDSEELQQYQEELAQIYAGLSEQEKNFFLDCLLRQDNFDKRLLDSIMKANSVDAVIATDADGMSSEKQIWAQEKFLNHVQEARANGEEFNTDAYYEYVANSKHYDSDVKAYVVYKASSFGAEEYNSALEKFKQCNDYYEIVEKAGNLINIQKTSNTNSSPDTVKSSNTASYTNDIKTNTLVIDSVKYNSLSKDTKNLADKFENCKNNEISVNELKNEIINSPENFKEILSVLDKKDILSFFSVKDCDSIPQLIPLYVENNQGSDILETTSMASTLTSTIKEMRKCGGDQEKILNKWIISHPERCTKASQEVALEKMYKNNQINDSYSSINRKA